MLATWLTAVVLLAAGGGLAQPSADPPGPGLQPLPGTVGVRVHLRLERDGALTVAEVVTVPAGMRPSRTIRLRQPIGDDLERVYRLRGENVDNGGDVRRDAGMVTVAFNPGTSTLRYTVDGAVAEVGGRQEVRWAASGGWDTGVDTVAITFEAPRPSSSLTCLAGLPGSSTACTLAQITARVTSASEVGLAPGERVELAVGLPAGTVPANLRVEETFSLARAFRVTPLTGTVLAALLLAVLAGLGALWRARGRDAAALSMAGGPEPSGYQPLRRDGDRVLFASPDGVLPGQIGTVVDEHVDVVDVTATVVDLAVRNYLWLAEDPDGWRIVRRNPPDDSLRPYERAVYDGLLGDRDEVPVAELRSRLRAVLPTVRDALYADVVSCGWFARRPDTDRSLAGRAGVAVAAAGAVLTVPLAAFTTVALLGLAAVLAGAALAAGARHLPARTALGSDLLARLVVLRGYLHTTDADALPPADRELVFSRSLPYAVVLGETDRWLATFAGLDPAADGTPGLYWYSGQDGTGSAGGAENTGAENTGGAESPGGTDLRQFAARFPALLAAIDGALAEASHLRRMITT